MNTISSVLAASYTPPHINSAGSLQSQIAQAFQNLAQALQSNNQTAVQQAYAALAQLLGQEASQNSDSVLSQGLSQIGGDLQQGNLSGAQQTVATLLQQLAKQASAGQLTSAQDAGGTSSTDAASSGQWLLNVTA